MRGLFAIAAGVLSLSIVGCTERQPVGAVPEDDGYVEPIEAAFRGEDIGAPLDWSSLGEQDKTFLTALYDRDAVKAKEALAAGATSNLDCGHGLSTLMLAAATGDRQFVEAIRAAGGKETPGAQPYLEILAFEQNAKQPQFLAALAELEKLAGKKPQPGDRTGLFTLPLEAEAAARLLEDHHVRLLERGCYVFLYDQRFGISGEPDVLWILPTTNKFAVMAFTGVNGDNYEISNHLVIRWMKRLEQDQPYALTGCGFDFLSGRFTGKLKDPAAMAQRMYEFCPDIVEQGTGSVEDLVEELKRTNGLYFWWD